MSDYYGQVGAYYDEDAAEFDNRYWRNPVLQRIRQAFREEVKRVRFESALEVGCGTGLDLRHFATIYPDRQFLGIDVSPEMIALAQGRLRDAGVSNARAVIASAEDAPALTADGFDLVYVFFGALNTVEDLSRAANRLFEATAPGGHLVLTFVNRWYLAEIAIGLLRGRGRGAFRRLRQVWGGYNPNRPLESRCLSPSDVHAAFGREGRLVKRRGFSILYPAWYRARWLGKLRRAQHWLWDVDEWLSRTPAWSWGEYTLYVFEKPR